MSVTSEVKVKKEKKEKSSKKRKSRAIEEPEKSEDLSTTQTVSASRSSPSAKDDESDNEAEDQSHPHKKRKTLVDEIEVDITKPEPPSKKALRLLKKGKPLPPSKSGADPTPEETAAKEKKAAVEKRSEHGIWIGNLPWTISKDDLRKFFTEYSDITDEQITRIHMPGPRDSKSANKVQDSRNDKIHNKGFAYVDFSTADGVKLAIELSEQLLGGRKVLIKDQKSFEGRPEKTKEETRRDGKPPNNKVFMGNLSFDTTKESLTEHFEKCGEIQTVQVATFEDSGKCKGYAWVTFQELEAAEKAVRGYVMIEEEIEDGSEPEGSDSEEEAKPKTKTRKWWVNKIKGRPLRMEFAEDAQVRYKKRYGKDGTKNQSTEGEPMVGESKSEPKTSEPKMRKPAVEYRQPYAPRLTGGIIASEGKKITF